VALAPAPEVEAEPEVSAPLIEWLVFIPGREAPIRVQATDIASAAARAAELVPGDLLAHASIWRADEAAPAGGDSDLLL
jgi:hypothetical protein